MSTSRFLAASQPGHMGPSREGHMMESWTKPTNRACSRTQVSPGRQPTTQACSRTQAALAASAQSAHRRERKRGTREDTSPLLTQVTPLPCRQATRSGGGRPGGESGGSGRWRFQQFSWSQGSERGSASGSVCGAARLRTPQWRAPNPRGLGDREVRVGRMVSGCTDRNGGTDPG